MTVMFIRGNHAALYKEGSVEFVRKLRKHEPVLCLRAGFADKGGVLFVVVLTSDGLIGEVLKGSLVEQWSSTLAR